MAELLLLTLVFATAGLVVAWPLLEREPERGAAASGPPDRETALVRHRLALEVLRDVEADHRSRSLDDAGYAEQRAEAEARAAETLAAADAAAGDAVGQDRPPARGARGTAVMLGIGLAGLLLLGFALPPPVGVGERTVTDQALADAVAAEDARQATILQMLGRLQADPRDADALSALADAYLAGQSAEEQQRGAVALLALLAIEPDNGSAYRRLITAYINAGDWTDARSALGSYAEISAATEPDIPFFGGLIALRGEDDPAEAVRQFDRFLALAPHDPRAGMVLTLRERAAQQVGGT